MAAKFIDTPGTTPIGKVRNIAAELEAWSAKRGVCITVFYGSTTWPDHANRRCLDVMTWNAEHAATGKRLTAAESMSFGTALAAYVWDSRKRYGLNWVIWNRKIKADQNTNRGTGYWRAYTGGNPHIDHVHLEVASLPAYRAPSVLAGVLGYLRPSTRVIYLDKADPGVKASDSVYWIQQALNTVLGGANIPLTGHYDKATVAAAMQFQKLLGDDALDGDLGPLQVAALIKRAGLKVAIEPEA